jgi:O-antigen biosynthesis protein
VIWFPAQVPETFSYTLSVAMASGLPIVATDFASFRERLSSYPHSKFLAALSTPNEWIATLVEAAKANPTNRAPAKHLVAANDDGQHYLDRYLPPLIQLSESFSPKINQFERLLTAAISEPLLPDRGLLALFRIGRYGGHRGSMDAIEQQLSSLPPYEPHIVGRSVYDHIARHADALEDAYEQEKQARLATLAVLKQRTEDVQQMQASARNDARHIAHLDSELSRIVSSRSWRYTRPLRGAIRVARIVPRAIRTTGRILTNDRDAFARGWRILLKEGIRGVLNRARREIRKSSIAQVQQAAQPLAERAIHPLSLPTSDAPLLSILIPVYEQHQTTFNCLASLAEHFPNVATEIVIADDTSPTPASEVLATVSGVRFVRQSENLGFIGNVNEAAKTCRGEFLLILNNDTIACVSAIDSMIATFTSQQNVGLVGAKLLNADGTLQEAGGIVWRDGSAWNWGRGANPLDPRFNFLRDADYCSGAALMLRREVFASLGGFDEHYLPAYYEDTDLSFKIRERGLRVVYQPHAMFYHLEGVSHGKDPKVGIKSYQEKNQIKFCERWKNTLATHRANGDEPSLEARRTTKGCVLIVEACMITPDQDSGSIRLQNVMQMMREEGWHVVFLAENFEGTAKYRYALEAMGIEVLYDAWAGSVRNVLRERGHEFNVVMLCRHYVANAHLTEVRRYAPQARVIFDTVDLHYLRLEREAAFKNSNESLRSAAETKREEVAVVAASDVTLVVSPYEQTLLQKEVPAATVFVLSNVHREETVRPTFDERSGVMFVGGFRHPPNVDAIQWYAKEILPRLRSLDSHIETTIVGSNMPHEIQSLARPGLKIAGHVVELAPLLRATRVSIAPLRFGAGVKGKINEAMNFGIPVVATSLAIEGMHLQPGLDCLVADDADAFAQAIVQIYRNRDQWASLSQRGVASVAKYFSFEAARAALTQALGSPQDGSNASRPKSRRTA